MLPPTACRLALLFISLTFLLTVCAPFPKEGDTSNETEVTLTLQHRSSERSARAGSSSRATEFIVVVGGGTIFSEQGPTTPLGSGVLNLSSSQITLSLKLDSPLRLFIYRYAENFSISQLQTKLANQTLDQGAIDYGVTDNFTISSTPNTNQRTLTVKLQREITFLDSAVQGLSYTTGGRTLTTNQDGLLYYFPGESIELKLSQIPLGSYTNPPSILTPYSIMGVTEGTPTDNVTNLVRLLLSLDSDSDADNGIQLNTNQFNNLSGLSLADFNVDNLSFASSKVPGLTLPSVQKAQKHLSRTMRQKNLATSGSRLSSPLSVPLNGDRGFPVNARVGLAFAENLRSSSISASSLVLTDNQSHVVTGTVSVNRNWLLFKPTANLNQNTTYQATASAGLRSQSGQKLLDNYSWNFTTGDNSTNKFPRVIQKEPKDNASGIARNTIPTLTFEGPLFEGTSLQFELRYSGNQSLVSCSTSLWAASVHCLPNSLLDNNTSYTVTLLKDSLQSLENQSNDNISWRFTTGNFTTSNSASLQHIGEFNDNYTRGRVILLQVGEGASQYGLSDNSSAPAESEWQLPLFYPVRTPFVLSGAQGNQTVRVFYRDNQTQTLFDNQSLALTYDYSLPVGGLTLPEATNQQSLPYLIMAKDNLSGAWRHLITRGNTYPAEDLETWKVFPSNPINSATRQSLWDNITAANLSFHCVDKPTLQAFATGNSTSFVNSSHNTTNCAAFSDFHQLLPSWDNLTFRFDNLSQSREQSHTLWVQDRAGNIGWGLPFKIRFDNVTPDTSKTTVELDNLSSSFNGLSLKFNTTDNDTQFFLAQLDNSTTPHPYGSGWIRAQHNLLYSILLDNTSNSQQHTLHLWLRDKAGNIDNLTPKTVDRAWLYDGQVRVDNQSNPTVNAYAGLRLKYPKSLPSSYPMSNLQLQRASDNLTVNGQWNLDNDSLVFWSTGPLEKETNYQLKLKGFVKPQDNLTLYPSQLFQFRTDNQTLNLGNGLVAYYPLDNDTLDYSGNGLHGSQVGNVQFSKNRFNKLDSAYYLDGNSYIMIPDNDSLDFWPNLDFTIHFWIKTNNCVSNANLGVDLISKWDKFGISNYPYSIRCVNGYMRGMKYAKNIGFPSVKSVSIVDDDIYHSVSFVSEKNKIKLYINGKLEDTNFHEFKREIQNDCELYIGKRSTTNKNNFAGIIDDIYIYNRSLSFEEIRALRNVRELIPPMAGSVTVNNGSDNTSSDSLTLKLSAYDFSSIIAYQITDNGSFDGAQWRLDNLVPSDNVSFYTTFILGSSDFGERQLQVRFKDQAGNISQPFSDNITRLDTTPPQPLSFFLIGTAGNDNFTNLDSISFIDNASDDVNPVSMYLSENNSIPAINAPGWQPFSNSGSFKLSSGQGQKQIYLWFKDAAQNISNFLRDTITFDNVSPTANSILVNNGADNTTSSTVTLTFDNITGASHYFATDNVSATKPSATAAGWRAYPVNNTDNFTLTGTGNRQIRAWFKDEAGNIFGPKLDNITSSHGISYQTWSCSDPWPCTTSPSEILTTGKITGDINYNWGNNNIIVNSLDTGKNDYIAMKLTGNFVMPGTAGAEYSVNFRNQDDDSSRTIIDGTTIIEDWSGLHGPANQDNSTKLVGGQTYRYERYWSERDGGAVLRQYWKIDGIHNGYIFMKGEDFF